VTRLCAFTADCSMGGNPCGPKFDSWLVRWQVLHTKARGYSRYIFGHVHGWPNGSLHYYYLTTVNLGTLVNHWVNFNLEPCNMLCTPASGRCSNTAGSLAPCDSKLPVGAERV
jgi:hypothetical protein